MNDFRTNPSKYKTVVTCDYNTAMAPFTGVRLPLKGTGNQVTAALDACAPRVPLLDLSWRV
jgi:hypothetical protein